MRKRNPHKTSDPRRDTEEAVTAVRQIYAELKANPPERNCTLQTECCRFQLTGRIPMLTKGEAMTAAKALRAAGRKELPKRADGACPLLHPFTIRCMIYEGRPFGCRTHFCEAAGGPYERREVVDLIHRLEEIDENLGGEGTRELSVAISDALEEIR
ncbi:MAG: YkgJ family cysteine cluster protein [Chthoniobacterales bacterium]